MDVGLVLQAQTVHDEGLNTVGSSLPGSKNRAEVSPV